MPAYDKHDPEELETLVGKIRFMLDQYEDVTFINDWEFEFIESMIKKLINIEESNITKIEDKMFYLSSRQRWSFDKIWEKFAKEFEL